ncbi:MAG: Gfo/Idh/MocA family oxidoreductase [Thermomicrobiales bacterium]
MKHRCLMIGVGGMGARWVRDIWSPFGDRLEIAAVVDVDPVALQAAADWIGLSPAARFTDPREAFATVDADFCCIVTPPAYHQEAVELACARGLPILSEKPIADTWEGCEAIVRAVRAAGVKMMITQNYRSTARILTLKEAIATLGPVNYAVARYASDYRRRGSWGMFRHLIDHSLLVEGGIHHLDQLRNLCGANCRTIGGWDWNPGRVRGEAAHWRTSDSFAAEASALLVMQMTNGAFASYEGNNLATGKTNSWREEYYRVECEGGAAVLDRDQIVRIEERSATGAYQTREVPLVNVTWEGHQAVAAQFLDWLDGGPPPETTLDDNLQSTAMLFAAIQASETGQMVDVQAMLRTIEGAGA